MAASNSKVSILTIILFLAIFRRAEADPVLSNLGDVWTEGGIGDIHGLFPGGNPYGSDTVSFTTGAGTFSLNSITLEFEFDATYPAGLSSPQSLSVQLFQKVGATGVLVGNLGNPVADSASTQWPQSSNPRAYTEFIDYSPQGTMKLNPLSQYYVTISMPGNSSVDAALMFTKSTAYTSEDGWVMGSTDSGDSSASGESLKLGVNATRVPDGANTAGLVMIGLGFIAGSRRLFRKK